MFYVTNSKFAAAKSDFVVLGTVSKIGPARWSTGDGKRPLNPHLPTNIHSIFTPITIRIDEQIKGPQISQVEIQILAPFGSIDGDIYVTDDPRYEFTEGEKVLIYLKNVPSPPHEDLRRSMGETIWAIMERYTATSTQDQTSYSSKYETRKLEDLKREIEAAPTEVQK
ncbi:MAG: hypothetical protein HC853_02505 [Anaerolineae bacterium]|nr:hypothetical protein [Anaerolineae bacterium]